jgi:hypothetical protein
MCFGTYAKPILKRFSTNSSKPKKKNSKNNSHFEIDIK